MSSLVQVPCPLCDSNDGFVQVYSNHPSRIVRCKTCDLVFFNPQPSLGYLREYYSSQTGYLPSIEENLRSFQKDPASWKQVADFILGKVAPHLPLSPGQRILDIGCAYGFFLLFAQERGFEAHGVEISSETSRYAVEQGVKVINKVLLEAAFPPDCFSVISMNNVLEHTLNPMKELREAHRIMADQGVLYVAVPNFGSLVAKVDNYYWKMKSWPNHLFYFTESTLTAMLRKAGFTVREVFTHQGESEYADDVRIVRDRLCLEDDDDSPHEVIRLLWKLKLGQELVILAQKERSTP